MKVYIAGKQGLAGSAIAKKFLEFGHEVVGKSSRELDFRDRSLVFRELERSEPDALIIAAARVGGIGSNFTFPVEFLSDNLQIQTNLMDAAHKFKVEKLIFLGSSCVYPKYSSQPISESALLTGSLEPTNEPYAIAKIAGIKLVQAYRKQYGYSWISIMPNNLYGPNDNFNLESGHALAALMHKFHRAKVTGQPEVILWGDGSSLREFLYSEDLAEACSFVLERYNGDAPINVGSGEEVSIYSLAELLCTIIGFRGKIIFDSKMPNGTPRKLLDSSIINQLGWKARTNLESGLGTTYNWLLQNWRSARL